MTWRLPLLPQHLLIVVSLWVLAPGCKSTAEQVEQRDRRSPAGPVTTLPSASVEQQIVTGPATMRDVTTTAPAQVRAPSTQPSLRDTLSYLASDELGGRGLGSEGLDRTGEYISERFRSIGLEPAPGLDDYRQSFPMTLEAEPSPETTLAFGDQSQTLLEDFRPFSFSSQGTFSGPLAFAGYGIASDEHGYDDYANVDVNGKVVLAMRFEPHTPEGKSRFAGDRFSNDATFMSKFRAATDRGASALLFVTPPTFHGEDVLLPPATNFPGGPASIPVLQITQRAANELLTQAGAPSLVELQARIDETGQPASLDLPQVTVSGDVKLERQSVQVANIVGVLPGRGPNADQYVIVGAHYDHLGTEKRPSLMPDEDPIYNGADDNASGTTAMLHIAERLARGGPPERSILFVAFTAEEVGLIGSKHFVDNPPVPLNRVVAMLNLDMVGRSQHDMLMIGGAGTAEAFDRILAEADNGSPLVFHGMGRGGFGPSDHMSFAMKRIPVLFFFTGLHDDYHRPSDEPQRINYEGLGHVVNTLSRITRDVAAMPRQAYVDSSDHTSYQLGSPTGAKVTLGVVPDYSAASSTDGARISGVAPGSAAEQAGLKPGDTIVQFGDRQIRALIDLSAALAEAEPEQTVELTIQRGGETIRTTATLQARKGQ